MSEDKKMADTFQCPSCGGNMTFDPTTQSLKCGSCGSIEKIETFERPIVEYDFKNFLRENKDKLTNTWEEMSKILKCKSCGAEIVVPPLDTSIACSFCGSSHVEKLDNKDVLKPENLIPFKISFQQSQEIFKKWAENRFMTPFNFKKLYSSDKITGLYAPYWTFDSNTFSNYAVQLGTHYTTMETYTTMENGKSVTHTRPVVHTIWHTKRGTYSEFCDDVFVNGSKNVDPKLSEKVSHYDFKQLVSYNSDYLSGFKAEKYSINIEQAWGIAQEKIREILSQHIRSQQRADEVGGVQLNTQHDNVTFKYVLVPLWISVFNYKNKSFVSLINGQTGRIEGHYPISVLKVIFIVIISVLVVGAGVYFLNYYTQ